jgi:Holliday junction resolvase-like predicted endonuclease
VPKPQENAGNRAAFNITGVAGEYFVAAELSRRGWIATVTLKNTPTIDVVATTQDGERTVVIQVKTRSIHNRKGWVFGKGMERTVAQKNFYIAFVDLMGIDEKPDYYLIPKNLFARWISKGHQEWLATPGRDGKSHIDNPIRAFPKSQLKEFEEYHNNWNL